MLYWKGIQMLRTILQTTALMVLACQASIAQQPVVTEAAYPQLVRTESPASSNLGNNSYFAQGNAAQIEDLMVIPAVSAATPPAQQIHQPVVDLPEASVVIESKICTCGDCGICESRSPGITFGDWFGYNSPQSDTTWLVGNGDDLGMFSLENYPNLKLGKSSSFSLGTGFHFVNGPIATDLPPRLFDLVLAYQKRKAWSSRFMYDMRLSVGAFTDFEGSVRKGIRFPGHFVTFFEWHPWLVSVLGIEAPDRDDVSVLPVAGFVWRPNSEMVIEAVFPRPKIQTRIRGNKALYLSGELGGGTWAIERVGGINDNATYRDFRVMLGIHDFGDNDSDFEIGWAFGRKLEYRSGIGDYNIDDTLLIRWRTHY